MANIFSDLEMFGINNTGKVNLFEDEKSKEEEKKEKSKKEIKEEDLIFDKTYTCPVCDNEFRCKTVKNGKVRFNGTDSDLRPRYDGCDSIKYDVVLCPKCGYAALNRYWNFVMDSQSKLIKENISKKFSYKAELGGKYSYEEAIRRYKMALLNTVVKNGKDSEKAYTCLKIAWLYRGKREELLKNGDFRKDVLFELVDTEKEFLINAFEGFKNAYDKESFPICGMDRQTILYLMAELARRIGKDDESKRYVSKLLTDRQANARIKKKAFELKDKLLGKDKEAE